LQYAPVTTTLVEVFLELFFDVVEVEWEVECERVALVECEVVDEHPAARKSTPTTTSPASVRVLI
jgi:hypothetical protein